MNSNRYTPTVAVISLALLSASNVTAQTPTQQVQFNAGSTTIVFEEDTEGTCGCPTTWNIASVTNGAGTAIPVYNIVAGEPMWRAQVIDENGTMHIVDPTVASAVCGGASPPTMSVSAPESAIAGPLSYVKFAWSFAFSNSPISSMHVEVYVFAITGTVDGTASILGQCYLYPAAGHELCLDRLQLPRLAVGNAYAADELKNYMYVPTGDGNIIANYTSPNLYFNPPANGNEFVYPSPVTISHQWWGYYGDDGSASPSGLKHHQSSTQLLFVGSHDLQGWAKSVRVTSKSICGSEYPDDPVYRYSLWEGASIPANNRTPKATFSEPIVNFSYFWIIGALPSGSDWAELAEHYRVIVGGSPRIFPDYTTGYTTDEHFAPQSAAATLGNSYDMSARVRDALLMLNFAPLECTDPSYATYWTGRVAATVNSWKRLLVDDVFPCSNGTQRVLTMHYDSATSDEPNKGALDKYLNLCAPGTLTPNFNPSLIGELSLLAADPRVDSSMYIFCHGLDVETPSFAGVPPIAPPPVPLLPSIPHNDCHPSCETYPCTYAPNYLLRSSYQAIKEIYSTQTAATFDAFSEFHARDFCDDTWLVCPDSNAAYKALWGRVITEYFPQLSAATSGNVRGAYLDNMSAPEPLCYYEGTGSQYHDHGGTGGGNYWLGGVRRTFSRLRSGARANGLAEFFTYSEGASEDLLGVTDMQSAYHFVGEWRNSGFAPWAGDASSFLFNTPFPPAPNGGAAPFPWSVEAGAGFRVTPVPGFSNIYGHTIYRRQWGRKSIHDGIFNGIGDPPWVNELTTGPHPGNVAPWASFIFHAFEYEDKFAQDQASATGMPVDACSNIGRSPLNGWLMTPTEAAGLDFIPIHTVAGRTRIATDDGWNPRSPQDTFENVLWAAAERSTIPDALTLHFKHQILTYHDQEMPIFPYAQDPDPSFPSGSTPRRFVADSLLYKFQQQIMRVKGDWKAWYMTGKRRHQPFAEPVAWCARKLAFASRMTDEIRDTSFVSCYVDTDASTQPIVVVTNWMPFPATFKIAFDPARTVIGATTAWSFTVDEFVPVVGSQSCASPPTNGVPFGGTSPSASFPNRLEFTTSELPPASVRVYRLTSSGP